MELILLDYELFVFITLSKKVSNLLALKRSLSRARRQTVLLLILLLTVRENYILPWGRKRSVFHRSAGYSKRLLAE